MILSIHDFLQLRNELPVADVRSQGEFAAGHMKHANNIPILNDAERVAVGTDYKQKGQLEAIKTGFRLVGPRIHDIVNEAEQLAKSREILVHCWRGGMRSSNFSQFIGMAKIKSHQLQGGYKAYRAEAINSFRLPLNLIILGGLTGSGKSEILHALKAQGEQVIDLENLSNHKGSVFGGLMMAPQPTTEQFQNDLFEEILKLDLSKRIWVEDESITIGKIVLPEPFWRNMMSSAIVEMSVSKEVRINRLVNEYGQADHDEFLTAMSMIVKKLGGQHYLAAKQNWINNDRASAIDILLTYYDKAYQTGLTKKQERIRLSTEWNGEGAEEFASCLVSAIS